MRAGWPVASSEASAPWIGLVAYRPVIFDISSFSRDTGA
jgi:hypothetical protein